MRGTNCGYWDPNTEIVTVREAGTFLFKAVMASPFLTKWFYLAVFDFSLHAIAGLYCFVQFRTKQGLCNSSANTDLQVLLHHDCFCGSKLILYIPAESGCVQSATMMIQYTQSSVRVQCDRFIHTCTKHPRNQHLVALEELQSDLSTQPWWLVQIDAPCSWVCLSKQRNCWLSDVQICLPFNPRSLGSFPLVGWHQIQVTFSGLLMQTVEYE